MKFKLLFTIVLFAIINSSNCIAQEKTLYKEIDSTKLFLETYYPAELEANKSYPAMIFFFGGGWTGGNRSHFINHAQYFSKRGIVCFLADYRTKSKNNTTPFESLKDAKSAMRFIRKNASNFKIDSAKIIASGGSAGGHLAAATALIEDFNETTDDISISSVPNALVLYNPVIDNGPGGYGYERIGATYKSFSPLHNIKKGAPPTILFLGTKDKHIPVETVQYYKTVMNKVESRCELKIYEGQGHGFFNYANFENYKKTITETDIFLQSLGYLKKEPVVAIK
ncbi:alpha/beta hydrolase [Aurantibacter crassamenti]|uniref:alpha/beta hydrolase n=1 Tax=Aurantibacter crassamenti TaxID=1837375 RepID=UPI00193A210F|nr:alpha/beta hydrolase [Aurantibacter crassamenti]MBM1108237.1 alpha/beta hydrolase [Aurantibacter crassamenti]